MAQDIHVRGLASQDFHVPEPGRITSTDAGIFVFAS
jgi:hypothetical protein